MRIGLSNDFGTILYNLSRNQQSLGNLAKQLSSGLRINSAADDPSGLAIAESLKSVSNGLQQGVQNVQTANNALIVAESAMKSITEVIQRMRSLVVEANSDLNSQTDLNAIQAEINQLTLEINRISQNTNFNGLHLLDGSLSSTQTSSPGFDFVSNPTVNGGANQLIDTSYNAALGTGTGISSNWATEFSFSVDSYDASTNTLQVTFKAETADPNGPNETDVLHVTPGTVPQGANFFSDPGFGAGSQPYTISDQYGNPAFQFAFNSLSASDVGAKATVIAVPGVAGSNGHSLEVNDSGTEGGTVAISINAMNTAALNLDGIAVGDQLANQAAEYRIDNALNTVVTQRAQIGAQMVALNYDSNDASNQIVQQTTSESSIRDLNVGAATTEFTRQQILVQVGTNVLSQSEVDTTQLTALYINALVA